MSEIKNYGKSIRARLLNVAKQEDVFYQTILTRYFQERLLYRISQTHYRENFYLKGGDYARICSAVKNMIANITGMICDGAKPSCSLKISSGVSTASLSALLAMEGKNVSSAEGIIDEDVDRSIHNLTSIGADAMCATDAMVPPMPWCLTS